MRRKVLILFSESELVVFVESKRKKVKVCMVFAFDALNKYYSNKKYISEKQCQKVFNIP